MSLAPPESAGPLRRERLRTARLYFVCEARPRGEDPEPLLRAALRGGVDIVQLREKSLRRREIERSAQTFRRLCDTYSALFIVNDDPDLARACDADGVHVGQDDMPAAEAREHLGPGRDHRPLDPLRGADRRRGGEQPVDYISVGPIWETPTKEGRPAVGLELVSHAAGNAAHALLRDRRHRPGNAAEVVAAGAQAARRRAGDPRRRGPGGRRRKRCAAPSPRRGGGAAVAERARKRKERRRPARRPASGWSAATPAPRSATGRRARRSSRSPRASGPWW